MQFVQNRISFKARSGKLRATQHTLERLKSNSCAWRFTGRGYPGQSSLSARSGEFPERAF
jgi:hypothetical protein